MAQYDVLEALRALGGRSTAPEIRSWLARTSPRGARGNVDVALRRLERGGLVRVSVVRRAGRSRVPVNVWEVL